MMTQLLNKKLRHERARNRFSAVKGVVVLVFAMLASASLYAQPMSGTYTVCGSGCDYQTVVAAANDLNSKGVSGPVTINVAAGTYTNSVTLYNVSGASATNTITFKGAGAGNTKILVSSGQALRLDNSKYITFEDFHFENTGTTYGLYVYYAQNCAIKNSIIKTQLYTTSFQFTYPLYHVYSTGMTYENNIVQGGYYGMFLQDLNTANGYHLLKENRVTNFYQYGMYLYGQNGDGYNVFEGNFIDSALATTGYAIMAYYQNRATFKNNMIGPNGIYYGLYLLYPNYYNYSGSVPTVVENNVITASYGSGGYPLYVNCISSNYIKVSHNTVHSTGTPTYGCYVNAASGPYFEFTNNSITMANAASSGTAYINVSATSSSIWGNNFYDGTNTPTINWNGTTYSGIAAYVSGSGHKYSSSIQMPFKSATDYHLDQSLPAPSGFYSGINVDMDGDSRCLLFPTTGADESSYGKSPFKAKFFVPSIIYKNSPVTFYNFAKDGEPKIHRWYIDGVKVSENVNLENITLAGPTHVISLATQGCAGTDSTWQTVTITTPAVVPVSDFIASQNQFLQGGKVSFTDISTYGPSDWKWEITPATYFTGTATVPSHKFINGTTDSSQNPEIEFAYPGKYQVCMTATNAKGAGNKECKANYITVLPAINFPSSGGLLVREEAGYLFDEGGPNGQYSSTGSPRYIYVLLDPCASEVSLVIDKFDLESGWDYLRIYDGDDTSSAVKFHIQKGCSTNMGFDNAGPGFTGPAYSSQYDCLPSPNDTFVAKSGKMLLEFYVDHYTSANGWVMNYWSTPKTFLPPVASFEADSAICQNGIVTFTNTSTGEDNRYFWDLDGDISTIEDEAEDETQWVYPISGQQKVTLIAQNCGGFDTLTKTINVFVPNKPTISFEADNLNPTTSDIVYFTGSIPECVDDYEWTFTHSSATVQFENGSSKFSEEPQVIFPATGCWNVTLKATNSGGTSTLTKTCYINVKDAYCTPSVAVMVPDVGISEVGIMLPTSADTTDIMRNSSDAGIKDYNNYVSNKSLAINAEIGVTYILEVKRNSAANKITRSAWIDWNLDGDFDDPAELLDEEVNSSSKDWLTTFTVPIIAKPGATVLRIASNTGQYSNEVCGQNRFGEYEDYRVYVTNDRTAPIITLLNAAGDPVMEGDTMIIEQGRNYVEHGFKAIDNLDGDITSNVSTDTLVLATGATGTLNTFVVRDYGVRYNVTDASGNPAKTAMRIVRIIKDSTAPTLEVEMPEIWYEDVDQASGFQMPKVIKVDDLVDGVQVTQKVEVYNNGVLVPAVDPAVVDTYEVHYIATDDAGNTTTVIRTIIVQDLVAPALTLKGQSTIQHPVHTEYTDEGVDINDNYYDTAMLRALYLQTSNNVNVNMLGTYLVTYTISDPSGNGPITVTRTVEVVDNEAPVVTTTSPDAITVDVRTEFEYPELEITDNYYKNEADISVVPSGTLLGNLDTDGVLMEIGTFDLQYTITDPSNNVTTKTFTVEVVDRFAPEVDLVGGQIVTVCRWENYVDAGIEIDDNYYEDSTDFTIDVEGSFIDKNGTDLEGLYYLRYVVTDASDNTGYSDYRQIFVKSPNELPCSLNGIEDSKAVDGLVSIYPNPSAGNITVKVDLAVQEQLRISVMNLLGEEVAVVSEGQIMSGMYNVDLSAQASGVYLLKVQGGEFSLTKRIVINK